jgi:hypothetical protein
VEVGLLHRGGDRLGNGVVAEEELLPRDLRLNDEQGEASARREAVDRLDLRAIEDAAEPLHEETVGLFRGEFDGETIRFGRGALAHLAENFENERAEEQLVVDAQGGEVSLDPAIGLIPFLQRLAVVTPASGRFGKNKRFNG